MKRQARLLFTKAVDSLVLGIEHQVSLRRRVRT